MAFDGIVTKNIICELNKKLINARVEKIYVPNKNEIFFNLHTQDRENLKLLISIDANNARFHFTKQNKDNPIKAPQICMILRKYLQGAKVISINQHGLDRVIIFSFQNINELGDLVNRKLAVELMGKYSNVILMDDSDRIIDAMRHVDISMSSVREVLPNKKYSFPTTLGKINFDETSFEEFNSVLSKEEIIDENSLCNNFIGFSKSFSKALIDEIGTSDLKKLYERIKEVLREMDDNFFTFKAINDGKDYVLDFDNKDKKASYFLDEFYLKKEQNSIIKNAKLNLAHEVNAIISKINKKLEIVNSNIEEAKDLEKYKMYGELLNCNLHLVKQGMKEVQVINFYDNSNQVTIPLKTNITPSQNAQSYFKKYTKLKSSLTHASKYKNEYECDIDYLKSVLCELELAENLFEVDEIRNELISEKYINKKMNYAKTKEAPSEPIKYEFNGTTILVGRNNIQNDRLTFKIAKKNFTWLHVKKFHGSHVIIESENVSDECLVYAAKLAAKHSETKSMSKVEVDYTLVKFVHKEVGAKPGMVVYTDYKTIVV